MVPRIHFEMFKTYKAHRLVLYSTYFQHGNVFRTCCAAVRPLTKSKFQPQQQYMIHKTAVILDTKRGR